MGGAWVGRAAPQARGSGAFLMEEPPERSFLPSPVPTVRGALPRPRSTLRRVRDTPVVRKLPVCGTGG